VIGDGPQIIWEEMRMSFKPALTAVALGTCLLASPGAKAQAIFRHAADFFKFDGSEFITNTSVTPAPSFAPSPVPGSDGALFYTKTAAVPAASNTLYVSLYTTGDTHGGAAEWFSCRTVTPPSVTQIFCRPSFTFGVDEAPDGWISLLKLPQALPAFGPPFNNCFTPKPPTPSTVSGDGGGGSADCHDNGIAYSWCVPVRGGSTVTVNLRMASSITGQLVFIEKGHVYIDSSFIRGPNRCTPSPLGSPAAGEASDPLAAALRAAAAAGDEVAGSTTPGQQQ
jgi:hypothetical protein